MNCVICKLPIAHNEGFMGSDGLKHRKPQWCIAALEAENAALREDKARLDRLEGELRYCTLPTIYVGIERGGHKRLRICTVHAVDVDWHFVATDHNLRPALDKAFAHLDAARKETSSKP